MIVGDAVAIAVGTNRADCNASLNNNLPGLTLSERAARERALWAPVAKGTQVE